MTPASDAVSTLLDGTTFSGFTCGDTLSSKVGSLTGGGIEWGVYELRGRSVTCDGGVLALVGFP